MLKALQCMLVLQSVSVSVCQCMSPCDMLHFIAEDIPSLYAFSALPQPHMGKNSPSHTHTGAVCLGIWRSGVVNEQEVVSLPWTK